MGGLQGKAGAYDFKSRTGGGAWAAFGGQTNPQTGQQYTIPMLKNLASDLASRGIVGLVPAVGIRVRGTMVSDAAVGAQLLHCSRQQRSSFITFQVQNEFQNPMSQQQLTLATWAYVGMLVNPEVEYLDQRFFGDEVDVTTNAFQSKAGIVPASQIAPINVTDFPGTDGATGGTSPTGTAGAVSFKTENPSNYPGLDRYDSYWRQLEGLVPVRNATTITTLTDDFYSVPLCATTVPGQSSRFDVIPLDTLCDPLHPWQFQVGVNRTPNGKIVGFDGGSWTIDQIDLYVYIVPIRKGDDAIVHGNPYIIRPMNRAQSPLQYNSGDVIMFTGSLPDTQADVTTPSFRDTVDTKTYHPPLRFGDFSPDLAPGLTMDWYVDGAAVFPVWFQKRSIAHVINEIHNSRPVRHLLRFGRPGQVVVRGGRQCGPSGQNQNSYDNIVDANLVAFLGQITPQPVRVFAETALDAPGFPGFGTLSGACAAPFIQLQGNWNFGSTNFSSINNMVDVVLNRSDADAKYIEKLGQDCCVVPGGSNGFVRTVDDPASPKAGIVQASGITVAVQDVAKIAPKPPV